MPVSFVSIAIGPDENAFALL